ncbi:melanocyte-stimulating hormone receptor-like [Acropora muricata]|uniref:melanocyte-stimulating hormone receptor-like n=1 Tax=Acropora muricata TaxID=159855 RepID=UPI0034E41A31
MTDSHPIFVPKVFCSAELNAGLHNQLICFTIVSIIVALTTVVGNTLILIALYKETSLHQPSKILLCCLASSDLCLGYSTRLFVPYWISSLLKQKWQTCQHVHLAYILAGGILFGVSLFTTNAISVDRLLALLLGIRYRQIVTVKRVYAAVVVIWVSSFSGLAVQFYIVDEKSIIGASTMFLCLILSMYCYLRIYLKLRHRQSQVRQINQTTLMSLTRYRKTVCNALWVQSVLFFCVMPFCVVASFAYAAVVNRKSSAFYLALLSASTLIFLNGSVNPFLYWKIKQVRQAVINTLRNMFCFQNR